MPADEEPGDFCWGTMEMRALHPVRAEIIEALLWIGLPLSAADLLRILGVRRLGLRVEYHLRLLSELGVVRQADSGVVGQRSYCLPEQIAP